MKISIVVPVYNTASYLERCVDSILGQDFKDIELVLIDDGSTDNSLEICQSYAALDARVVCMHKDNGGVSSARNAALSVCTGDYVWFVDSDDALVANALSAVANVINAKRPSMIVFPEKMVDERGEVISITPAPLQSANKNMGPLQCGDPIYPHQRVTKRSLLAGRKFDTSLTFHEDRAFFYPVCWLAAGDIAVIDEPLYLYLVTRGDSAINSLTLPAYRGAIDVNREILVSEQAHGFVMPALEMYIQVCMAALIWAARNRTSAREFSDIRNCIVEEKQRLSLLNRKLRLKCKLAIAAPGLFCFAARAWNIVKRW